MDASDGATLLAVAERTLAPGETSHGEPFKVNACTCAVCGVCDAIVEHGCAFGLLACRFCDPDRSPYQVRFAHPSAFGRRVLPSLSQWCYR